MISDSCCWLIDEHGDIKFVKIWYNCSWTYECVMNAYELRVFEPRMHFDPLQRYFACAGMLFGHAVDHVSRSTQARAGFQIVPPFDSERGTIQTLPFVFFYFRPCCSCMLPCGFFIFSPIEKFITS